ncbi:hypothetical protein QT381_09185, partial [Galbitalea sp. SE-J8]|nr:hypothetical protein [Galbitalea sp. SE-J8]
DRPGAALGDALFALGSASALRFDDPAPAPPARAGGAAEGPRAMVAGATTLLRLVRARARTVLDSVRPRYRVLLVAGAVAVIAVAALLASPSGGDAAPTGGARGASTPAAADDRATDGASARPGARPAQDPSITGDDPVAAVVALAGLRAACLAAASSGCLAGVDEAGSAAERDDRALIADPTPASVEHSALDASDPVLVEPLGGAALVRLHDGAGTGPASVLVMRTEAGWRLRDYLDGDPGE